MLARVLGGIFLSAACAWFAIAAVMMYFNPFLMLVSIVCGAGACYCFFGGKTVNQVTA